MPASSPGGHTPSTQIGLAPKASEGELVIQGGNLKAGRLLLACINPVAAAETAAEAAAEAAAASPPFPPLQALKHLRL